MSFFPSVGGGTPDDGSVTTAKIAANAVHPAVVSQAGSGGSATINNNGTTELVEVSKAYTVSADVALLIVVQLGAHELRYDGQGDTGLIRVRLYEGSNLLTTTIVDGVVQGAATAVLEHRYISGGSMVYVATGLSAGSHTFEVRAVHTDHVGTNEVAAYRGDLYETNIQFIELLK